MNGDAWIYKGISSYDILYPLVNIQETIENQLNHLWITIKSPLVSSSQAEQQAEAAQAQAAAVAAAAQSIERKRRKPQVPKGELTVAEEITRISRNIPCRYGTYGEIIEVNGGFNGRNHK